MSKLYSVELIMDGRIDELLEVLNICMTLDSYDKKDLINQINIRKDGINKLNKLDIARVFLDYTTKIFSYKTMFTLSDTFPKMSFTLRMEGDYLFIEKQYKNGCLVKDLSFKNVVNWRIHTQDMSLNTSDVLDFIKTDLEYLIDEVEDFNEFKELVLNQFKNVKFTERYTKDDLLKDIKTSYEYLTE